MQMRMVAAVTFAAAMALGGAAQAATVTLDTTVNLADSEIAPAVGGRWVDSAFGDVSAIVNDGDTFEWFIRFAPEPLDLKLTQSFSLSVNGPGSLASSPNSTFEIYGPGDTLITSYASQYLGFSIGNAGNYTPILPPVQISYVRFVSGPISVSNAESKVLDTFYFQARNVVPEPSTWALMIVGFGSAGAMLRRQKPVNPLV